MKKIMLIAIITIVFSSFSFAYNQTAQDSKIINTVNEKLNWISDNTALERIQYILIQILEHIDDLLSDQNEDKEMTEEEVKEAILDKAEKDWPNDYTMQQYVYNQQWEAYLEMKSTTDYPSIMENAQEDRGIDYVMVMYVYESQVEAYKELNE